VAPAIWVDFSDITTLFQDSAGTTPVTADGQVIGKVADKSGNNNHLTQAGAAGLKPLYKASIQNSKSIARFDAADDILKITGITLNQPEHVFIVAKYNGAFDFDDTLFDGATNNTMRLYRTDATTLKMFAGTANVLAVTTTPQSWHILRAVFSGASSKLGIDSGAYSATANVGSSNAGGLTLNATGGGTLLAGCDIAEVLVFPAAIGATPDAAIISYLNTKWAVF
jgi:hypothetical protein